MLPNRSTANLIHMQVTALTPGKTQESKFQKAQNTRWRWVHLFKKTSKTLKISEQLCQRMCHQKTITETCNCYWPSLSLPSFEENSTSFSTFDK